MVDAEPVEGLWDLPDGWAWERLDAVAPVNPRRNFDGAPADAELVFLGMAAVSELTGALVLTEQRPLGSVRSGFTKFRSGDVIFAKITPCMENGKLAVIPDLPHGMGAGSTEFHVLEPQQVSARYLFHWLSQETFRNRAEHNMTGTAGQKRVPTDWLRNAPIPVPPSAAEQDAVVARIDALFAEIDEGEAALAEARAGVETYRKALLKAAVTGELTTDWRQANPPQETGEQLLQRILADRRARWHADPKNARKRYTVPAAPDIAGLSELPEGWAWASVACVVDDTTYGTSTKCDRNADGVPVLRMGNIQDGRLATHDMKYAAADSLPMLQPGDVLFNRTNSAELLGKSAVYEGEPSPCSFASYLVGVRLTHSDPHFFAAWLNSIYGKAWVAENKSQQVGQANLSAGKLVHMPLPIAPLEEQRVIVRRLNEALARANDQQVVGPELKAMSSDLRQCILAAAFRGELAI